MHSELCGVGVGQVAVTVTIVAVLWQFAVTGTAMAMLSVCCTPVATVLARPGPGPTGNVAMVMSYYCIDHGLAYQPDCQSNFDKPSDYCQNLQFQRNN